MIEYDSSPSTRSCYSEARVGIANGSSRDHQKRKRGDEQKDASYLSEDTEKRMRPNGNSIKIMAQKITHAVSQDMDLDEKELSSGSDTDDTSIWMNLQGDNESPKAGDAEHQMGTSNLNCFRLAVTTPTGHPHPYMSQDSFLSRMHLGAGYFDLI